MLRASALYLVIVIALVMAVICSSLITAAYFYKLQYQKTFRYSRLKNNLTSGLNILLESTEITDKPTAVNLFDKANDTVILSRSSWGVYQIGTVEAYAQQDTLRQVCALGAAIDSPKWAALYVIDEDRALSVSGKTLIRGTAYLPKAGISEAYVNNHSYEGDKRIVIGNKRTSEKTLPALNAETLQQLEQYTKSNAHPDSLPIPTNVVNRSFLKQALNFNLGKQVFTLTSALTGNIVVHSDTTLVLAKEAHLENVIIMARAITIKSGFQGTCQLFATDSIVVEPDCRFDYPSALGIIRFQEKAKGQEKLIIGDHTILNGIMFTYEKQKNELLPYISLGKETRLTGQIYSQGLLNYQDDCVIQGSVYTSRFLYQSSYTRYENYLINLTVDAPALSPYYVTSDLLPSATTSKKVLQWLK